MSLISNSSELIHTVRFGGTLDAHLQSEGNASFCTANNRKLDFSMSRAINFLQPVKAVVGDFYLSAEG